MGRTRYNKREHIENSNRFFENNYMKEKGLLTEQPAGCPSFVTAQNTSGVVWSDPNQGWLNFCNFFNTNPNSTPGLGAGQLTGAQLFTICGCSLSGGTTTTCDISCVNLSDTFTDSIVAQGGGPNSLQTYDPSVAYSPGSVVCHLDPTLGVTNVYVASANSGQLIPGGGLYPIPAQWVTAWPWPLPVGATANDYYWEPGLILASCGGNGTWGGTGTTGTTGTSGCLDPSLGGYDPQATLDCLGNPPPAGGGYGDTNCCGTPGPQEYVCMGGVVGPGGTNSCTGPHPMGTYQMGDPNVMGIYPTQTACDAACGSATTTCDFSWNSLCAQTHFGSLGGTQQFQNWLVQRESGFNSVGCQHLQNVVNWTTSQLNSGVTGPNANPPNSPFSTTQITRKLAKREWAICQGNECGCTLNIPQYISPNAGIGGCLNPLLGGYNSSATLDCTGNPQPAAGFGDESCCGMQPPSPPPPSPSPPPQSPKPQPGGKNASLGEINSKETINEEFTRMKSLWKYKI